MILKSLIRIKTSVLLSHLLHTSQAKGNFFFGSQCDPSLGLQLIQIEVRSTSGEIIESVEIVK